MLLALKKCPGYEWVNLPRQIYSHSYWVSETGEKMSKSLGNFLDPAAIDNYVREFGLDALRYFLATRGPLGTTDSTFSAELFAEVYNSDLANTFGNSCSRVTNMIGKYFEGKAPSNGPVVDGVGHAIATAKSVTGEAPTEPVTYRDYLLAIDLNGLAQNALSIVRAVDRVVEITEPFKRAKESAKLPEVGTILYNCAEALRIASVLLWPFIPDACEAFWGRIGCGEYAKALASNGRGDLKAWVQWGQLQPGTPIEKGEALFPRWQAKK